MTLSTPISKTSFTGNGATTVFPVPFPFMREDDIKVLLRQDGAETPLLSGTHFNVTGAGSPSGGSLMLFEPPATGTTLVLYRAPAIVQEVDYVENAAFPAETHEAALDLLTMICQALDEKIGRAVLYPVSTPQEDIRDSSAFLGTCENARDAAQAAGIQASAAATEAETQAALAGNYAAQAKASVGGLRVSAGDTTPRNLSAKLAAGDGLAETLLFPGADEALRLSLALAENSGLELSDGLLRAKIAPGGGLFRTGPGLAADLGSGPDQLSTNAMLSLTLRPAMVAGRVINHALLGGM
ncbi:MAG: hypothetical protein KKF77_06430 [Proteobacteria bacterium]|nr:hypothetical protein [Pseudomonadota bacterium]